jgi:hypothetical protein
MNLGALNGLWADASFVGSQYVGGSISYTDYNMSPKGCFYAPPEATHALITACAPGGTSRFYQDCTQWDETYTNCIGEWVDYYGGSGGAGAACFRVSMPLYERWIPYFIMQSGVSYFNTSYIRIGEYETNDGLGITSGISTPGTLAIVLQSGNGGSGETGGMGGNGYIYQKSNSLGAAAVARYTAQGGYVGGSGWPKMYGSVVTLPDGGILAGGAGGANFWNPSGHVSSGLGYMHGGNYGSNGFATGGASLFSPGQMNLTAGYGVEGRTYGGRYYTYSGYIVCVGMPGAGQAGCYSETNSNPDGYNLLNWFILCEFISTK